MSDGFKAPTSPVRKQSHGDAASLGTSPTYTKSLFLPPSSLTPGKSPQGSASKDRKPYVIGITGGSSSGKTTLAKMIVNQLKKRSILLLSLDSFYRPLTHDEKVALAGQEGFNFDLPSSFDFELLLATMRRLCVEKKPAEVPVYDFVTSDRVGSETVQPADVVVLEGILVLYWKDLRDMMDLRIFLDTNGETRLARRILRDTRERGRAVEAVLLQYERFVRPAFESYIAPTKEYSDIIVPRGSGNTVAISLIVDHIKGKLHPHGSLIVDDQGDSIIEELAQSH